MGQVSSCGSSQSSQKGIWGGYRKFPQTMQSFIVAHQGKIHTIYVKNFPCSSFGGIRYQPEWFDPFLSYNADYYDNKSDPILV